MIRLFSVLLVFHITCIMTVSDTGSAESIRTQEINDCRSNEIITWGDGKDRPVGTSLLKFAYNPTGAPGWFPAEIVAGMVARSAEEWSKCGVRTEMVRWSSETARQKDLVIVQWHEKESRGNFGLANLSNRTLSLGPSAFDLLNKRNPRHNAGETLQMVISHEMGHLFGLMAHSRRCVDVLSYYNNGKGESCFSRDPLWKSRVVEYRNLFPTACDIERCRNANGKPSSMP